MRQRIFILVLIGIISSAFDANANESADSRSEISGLSTIETCNPPVIPGDCQPSATGEDLAPSPLAPGVEDLPNKDSTKFNKTFGFGLSIPEVLPLEAGLHYSSLVAVRVFYVPTLPFNVRVEYEQGVIASQGELAIENPDINIDFDGLYKSQYGAEAVIFPFRGIFYLGLGVSQRALSLKGNLNSSLIISSPTGSISTNTVISVGAEVALKQTISRIVTGWWIPVGSFYVNFFTGYTFKNSSSSSLGVSTQIINPSSIDTFTNETIEDAERKLEQKISKSIRKNLNKVQDQQTPILGITFGISY